MLRRNEPKRREPATEPTPPWWTNQADEPISGAGAAYFAPPPPPPQPPPPAEPTIGSAIAEDPSTAGGGVDRYAGRCDGYDGELLAHDVGGGYDGQEVTEFPHGQWVDLDQPEERHPDVWVPAEQPARAVAQPGSALAPSTRLRPSAPFFSAARPSDAPRNGRARTTVDRPLAALRPVDPAEAVQLATCFALDYLSWDESLPTRRSEALRHYLPDRGDSTLGWSGEGRQRADFACAGQTMTDGHWLSVDVRVRVTPYEKTEEPASGEQAQFRLPEGGRWAAAPAPEAAGWVARPSVWMRLAIPIRRHDSGELVVDLSPIPEPTHDPEGDL